MATRHVKRRHFKSLSPVKSKPVFLIEPPDFIRGRRAVLEFQAELIYRISNGLFNFCEDYKEELQRLQEVGKNGHEKTQETEPEGDKGKSIIS